jgi:hypothetical protein
MADATDAAETRPPVVPDAVTAAQTDRFLLRDEFCDAYFIRRSDVLVVTFDNLASVGEYDPPQPWMHMRAARAGVSILGLIAHRKDWYRNPSAPRLLSDLRDAGLFDGFRRIVFAGASMGGFAALAHAPLVPGAAVLAFSPQSTLAPDLVPFESRYRYGARRWDWSDLPHRDAAEGAAIAPEVHLFYDPHVPEDRAHVERLAGAGVRRYRCRHFGHRAIRTLKDCDLLDAVFAGLVAGTFDEAEFWRGMRARRGVWGWRKAVLDNALATGHRALAARAGEVLGIDGSTRFGRRFRAALEAAPDPEPVSAPKAAEGAEPLFSGRIETICGALVVPERSHDQRLASGVLYPDGRYCEMSKAWIRLAKATPPPSLAADEPVLDVPGTHLFAGHMRGHFGHFLVESTARLWALGRVGIRLDGILYLPYRGKAGPTARAIHAYGRFFEILGIDVPVAVHGEVLRVERLVVPELGFGWGPRYAGSEEYRGFMRSRLSAAAEPEGGERLYVSRRLLGAQRGGVLSEEVIESNLARAGFEIFHPQKHPIETQIARYRAARTIVALDGSALHLAACVMEPDGHVAMVLRRSRANAQDYLTQFKAFCGIEPDVIDVIVRDWAAPGSGRSDYQSVGELDFSALFDRLKALGHLPFDFVPDLPASDAVREAARGFAEARGAEYLAPVGGDVRTRTSG